MEDIRINNATARIIHKGKNILKVVFLRPYERWLNQKQDRQRREINRILSREEEPQHYDSDEVFERLQQACNPLPPYGFDEHSTWKRGIDRALDLLKKFEILRQPGLTVLEAGCGDGMTGYMLASYGHCVALNDIEDWRDTRANDIHFLSSDLCDELPLNSGSFDLVYSYNTFEHLDDPGAALSELVRVCKSSCFIYIEFGPLYASPWGLHAHRTFRMPYPQFLFSKSFFEDKIKKLGIYDLGKKASTLQPMNQWRVSQFRRLWQESGCTVLSSLVLTDHSHLGLIEKFPKAFTGRGLTLEDVTTQALYVTLMKK